MHAHNASDVCCTYCRDPMGDEECSEALARCNSEHKSWEDVIFVKNVLDRLNIRDATLWDL
jgi:hypothetical protein